MKETKPKITRPVNIYDKECRLPFSSIGFPPFLLPLPLAFPVAKFLISGTTFLIALKCKCRLGGRWLLSNISDESFIRVPRNSLKPVPLKDELY